MTCRLCIPILVLAVLACQPVPHEVESDDQEQVVVAQAPPFPTDESALHVQIDRAGDEQFLPADARFIVDIAYAHLQHTGDTSGIGGLLVERALPVPLPELDDGEHIDRILVGGGDGASVSVIRGAFDVDARLRALGGDVGVPEPYSRWQTTSFYAAPDELTHVFADETTLIFISAPLLEEVSPALDGASIGPGRGLAWEAWERMDQSSHFGLAFIGGLRSMSPLEWVTVTIDLSTGVSAQLEARGAGDTEARTYMEEFAALPEQLGALEELRPYQEALRDAISASHKDDVVTLEVNVTDELAYVLYETFRALNQPGAPVAELP